MLIMKCDYTNDTDMITTTIIIIIIIIIIVTDTPQAGPSRPASRTL